VRKIINSIKSQIASNYAFEQVRSVEGKVGGTEFRYLFDSYDTLYSPSLLFMNGLFKRNLQDRDLYERTKKNTNIENYVADLYK
jgi:hypothetical protein